MRSSANRSYNANNGIPSGFMGPFAGGVVPAGWLACDGAAVSRTLYAALFAAIGTMYGVGDGATTFNVPDSRGRAIIPAGGTYVAGASGGAASITDVPAHTHTQPTHTHTQPTHTHGIGDHTHTTADHTHTQPTHTHTIAPHQHSIGINALVGVTAGIGGVQAGAPGVATDAVGLTTDAGGGDVTGAAGAGTTGASGATTTTASGGDATGASGGDNTGSTGSASVDVRNPYLCVPSAIIKY